MSGDQKQRWSDLRLEEVVSRLALRLGQLQDAMGIRIIRHTSDGEVAHLGHLPGLHSAATRCAGAGGV